MGLGLRAGGASAGTGGGEEENWGPCLLFPDQYRNWGRWKDKRDQEPGTQVSQVGGGIRDLRGVSGHGQGAPALSRQVGRRKGQAQWHCHQPGPPFYPLTSCLSSSQCCSPCYPGFGQ